MAAKDYKICPALFNAYIAKVSKRNPNMMLEDRREITEGEILMLIDWYLDKKCSEKEFQGKAVYFESHSRKGKAIKMEFINKKSL